MLLTQSKWFNNSCETETEKRGPGYGVRGKERKKNQERKNKMSSTIQWSLSLSPDSCFVHYWVSKETDNSDTHSHTHMQEFNLTD